MKPSTTKLKDLPCSTIASEQYTALSKHENIYVKGLIEWVELTSTTPSQSIGCIGVHYASRNRYTRAALWQKRGAGMRSGSSEWDSSSGEVRRARWGCLHRHRLDAYVHYANRYEGDYLIKARPSPHSNHRRREKNGKDDTNHEIMRWSWDGKSQYVYASDGDLNIICLLPPLFSESIAAAVQWVYCRQVSMDHHICFWKRYGNQ